ncbi:hypothetical protein HOY80DRAFT_1044620 [Tuber brumale]|nr:hypothetical protein HOY80DRAFT_1044620 [Tuber brumale]
MKVGINATSELKLVDDSSSNGKPGTVIDDQVILQEHKDRNKADTSDVGCCFWKYFKSIFKADTKKGTAVKGQQKTSDSLLVVRIKLLKAIVASSSRPAVAQPAPSLQPLPEPYKTTEDAALNRWNTLTALR